MHARGLVPFSTPNNRGAPSGHRPQTSAQRAADASGGAVVRHRGRVGGRGSGNRGDCAAGQSLLPGAQHGADVPGRHALQIGQDPLLLFFRGIGQFFIDNGRRLGIGLPQARAGRLMPLPRGKQPRRGLDFVVFLGIGLRAGTNRAASRSDIGGDHPLVGQRLGPDPRRVHLLLGLGPLAFPAAARHRRKPGRPRGRRRLRVETMTAPVGSAAGQQAQRAADPARQGKPGPHRDDSGRVGETAEGETRGGGGTVPHPPNRDKTISPRVESPVILSVLGSGALTPNCPVCRGTRRGET